MKIALYKSLDCGYTIPFEVTEFMESSKDHIRISEQVEVDFVELDKSAYAEKVLGMFDEEEKELRLKFANDLAKIDSKRQEFLALEYVE